ncbi:MAG: hypothetical protein K1060chlam1_01478 [Candidatus Anoxychlamydiales bacterium]|nr:hypothetical protein [Candidatus Anoxychlamydiales bacterium]
MTVTYILGTTENNYLLTNDIPNDLKSLTKSFEEFESILSGNHNLTDDEFENLILVNIDHFKKMNKAITEEVFFIAVKKNHIKIIEVMLNNQYIAIDIRNDEMHDTALILAAREGHQRIVEILLNNRANIEAKNQYYEDTALILAALRGQEVIVNILLEHNANIEVKNNNGETALILAARKGHKEIVKILLEHNALTNTVNEYGDSALILAAREGHEEIVNILLEEYNANIEAKNNNGDTALILAAKAGHKEIVNILLEHNANIEAKNNNGDTALILAALRGQEVIVNILLNKKANIEAKNNNGDTALILAAKAGHKEIVNILLEHNANIDVQNNWGRTALTQLSITKSTIEIVDLLSQKKGIKINYDITKIASIAKYANKLIKRLVSEVPTKASGQSNTAALILYPLIDYNNFVSIAERVRHVIVFKNRYDRVKIQHPTSEEQIKKNFERTWTLLLIKTHGSSEDLRFTEDFRLSRKNTENIFTSFKGRQIILDACYTGAIGGIAELIAKKSKTQTFAPIEASYGLTYYRDYFDRLQIQFLNLQHKKIDHRIIEPETL